MNDPVHGYVAIPDYVKKIIDTPIFQRLGYVKQLTSAAYVFPGATHTRKEHSIGVMHLANKYATFLFRDDRCDEYQIKLLTVAGLLHDVAHGIFSHAYDATVYNEIYPNYEKGHDLHRYRLVRETLSYTLQKIGINPEDIVDIWNGKNAIMSAIMKGAVSIDRMDFVNRDTYHTGTRHFGFFDIDRIIYNTSIYNNYIVYSEKIIPDIIQALTSRNCMYKQVYLHKTVVAASVLIELMIKEAKTYLKLVEKTNNLEEFVKLTDEYLLYQILYSEASELAQAKKYAQALYYRRLPKMINEEVILFDGNSSHETAGTFIVNNEIVWISRILTDDFIGEIDKYDVHIETHDGIIPFSEYCKISNMIQEKKQYYIKRIYSDLF